MTAETTVDTPSGAFTKMAEAWPLINDLLGGTRTMRAASTTWLPQERKEDDKDYAVRLNRSILYTALKDTVAKLSAKPFSKPVTLTEELPGMLAGMATNIDFCGTNITQFLRQVFEDGVRYGLSHVLVDFPNTGGGLSLGEERATGVRPYFVHVKAKDLIAWKSTKQIDGSKKVTHVRYREVRTEYVADFGEAEVEYMRVINETDWELWRKRPDESEYLLTEVGSHTFGAVPLVTFYTVKKDFMTAEPPLEGLAWLNLAHWQSSSDQRNILRFARLGIIFGSGFSDKEQEDGIVMSPNRVTISTNPDAKLACVDTHTKGITAGREDLDHLEKQMEVQGLQPLVQSTANTTALGRGIDEARTHSNIQAWIWGLDDVCNQAFRMAGKWAGLPIPDTFRCNIFSDFSVTLSGNEDVKTLILMRDKGQITQETLLNETKRRGLLMDDMDVKAEIDATSKEVPASLDFQDHAPPAGAGGE